MSIFDTALTRSLLLMSKKDTHAAKTAARKVHKDTTDKLVKLPYTLSLVYI